MPTPADRAARRRTEWTGEVVSPGAPKRDLYSDLSARERIRALAGLNDRAWRASGHATPESLPRDQWPSEVFEIDRRG